MDMSEIRDEIARLEKAETTYLNAEHLAHLYIVSEHLQQDDVVVSSDDDQTDLSEFEEAIAGKDRDAIMDILTDHMESLRMVYPKEYDQIMRRIGDV